MREHELRHIVDDEIHNRPPLKISAPGRVIFFAWLLDDDDKIGFDPAIQRVLEAVNAPPPLPDTPQVIGGDQQIQIKWERHSEFETMTLVEAADTPEVKLQSEKLVSLLDVHAGSLLVACRIPVLSGDAPPSVKYIRNLIGAEGLVGAGLTGGKAQVWTDFKIHEDCFSTMALWLDDISPSRAGRTIQRLLEIETYRMMAMLGFPVARAAHKALNRIEKSLSTIVNEVGFDELDLAELKRWFDQLQGVSAEASRVIDQSEYRLSATEAYAAIVSKRLVDIREQRLSGLTRLSVFLDRRMGPAMATCQSVRQRQEKLMRRIDSASSMFRARIEIAMGLQDHDILHTIKVNAERQVKLQRTVEGLSVVAVSYYLLSIIGIITKGGEKAGLFEGWEIISALIAPLAIGAVWIFLRRIQKKL